MPNFLKIELTDPSYYKLETPAWLEHGPFAMWLVKSLKPRKIVELGTHWGYSYFAMCEAVHQASLPTQCIAVDTWVGDIHAGQYGEEVFEAVSNENIKYSSFSKLLRKTFDAAREDIEDGTVDLLHVDGRHFYDDVKEDYEGWIPKLSDRAVVMFHDTMVFERGFGVHQYWQEISAAHPSFNFTHGHGLGVLFPGKTVPTELSDLIKLLKADSGTSIVQEFFQLAGSDAAERMRSRVEATGLRQAFEDRLQREISKSRELVHELNAQRCAIEAHLDSVVRELKNIRRKPLKQFGQLVKYKVLRGLSMARPIVSERAASRFARSAAKRHSSRVRPLPDILVDQHCSSPLNATAASDSALDTFADEVRTVHMLKRNHFFDSAWYKQQYGAQIGLVDPAMHFLRTGWRLGFDPSPHFLTRNYLDIYSDVRAADVNPLLHFLGSGLLEGRSPKPSPRVSALGVLRMGPEETGRPDEILKFDDEPTPVVGIENEKIAVHVHLYFTDMADDIVGRLINIRHPFTLLVSVSEGNDETEWQAFFAERLPVATTILVKVVPNIGRDVAPWLVNFADEVRENTIICHIHTKKSEHNSAHRGWFRYLGHTTLGSPNVVDSILRLLIGEERSGIVAPCYFWTLASQPNYGKNGGAVKKLFARLVDEPLPEKCPDYPAGSFFWARVEALAPLLDLALTTEDFEAEEEAIDGTLAHAVERMIGLLPVVTGLDLKMVTVDVAYDLINFLNNQRTNFKLPQLPAPAVARRAMQDERSVLYSCVSGGYEAVSDLVLRRQDADLVFFSDLEGVVPPNGFEARLSNYISPEPVRTARFVKTHPHVWFPQHKWAIWCDANIHFMGDLHTYIERVRSAGAEAGFIAHPVRETMQQEAEVLLENGIVKDATEVERQIARYLKDVPEIITSRLIETNFFVADLSSPNVQRFFQMWWSEINRYSHRDQLSINYAIERTGLEWVKLMPEGHSVRDRNDFLLFAHDFSSRDEIIAQVRSIDDVA